MADFRDHVIEAAAQAIEHHWNDAPYMMMVDPHAFFAELAAVALKAGADAGRMPYILICKTTDGKPIKVEAWDKGDILPGFDKDGRRFEAYTTYFRGPDWEDYVHVDIWKAEGNVHKVRQEADIACLVSHGIDPTSIEVQ